MKLTQRIIRQIIKEELVKVLNEDLYASQEEYEEAISEFMEEHGVSREEAKKAIDDAGAEMDEEYPMHARYIERDKEAIHNYKEFLRYAKEGQSIIFAGSESEYTEQDAFNLIYDFKVNYEKYKNIRKYKKIVDGYEYCINKSSTMDVRSTGGEKHFDKTLSDFGSELSKTQEPLMTRDLTAANRMRKSEKEAQQLMDKRNVQCEEKLGFALIAAHKREKDNKIQKKRYAKSMRDKHGERSPDYEARRQGFQSAEEMYRAYSDFNNTSPPNPKTK